MAYKTKHSLTNQEVFASPTGLLPPPLSPSFVYSLLFIVIVLVLCLPIIGVFLLLVVVFIVVVVLVLFFFMVKFLFFFFFVFVYFVSIFISLAFRVFPPSLLPLSPPKAVSHYLLGSLHFP